MLGIIIAAGKQTRFNSDEPKCMQPYKSSDTLTINIKTMLNHCEHILIATSVEHFETIRHHLYVQFGDDDRISIIMLTDQKGCGHAVFNVLLYVQDKFDKCIIKWGDAIHDNDSYYKFVKSTPCYADMSIPCEFVENPYTYAIFDTNLIINNFMFGNKDTKTMQGWHDLSIFYISDIKFFMSKCKEKWLKHENKFLKSICKMDIIIKMLPSSLRSKSYNTIMEFKSL